MKLTCTKPDLLRALAFCSEAVDRKSPNFAAGCVLLTVAKDIAHVAATDGIISARASVTTLAGTGGSFGLGAAGLLERVRALPDGDLTIEVKGVAATLRSGKRKYTLKALPGADFPPFREGSGAKQTIPGGALASLLGSVSYASHPDSDGKYHGITLTFAPGSVRADAATGRGMATRVVACPIDACSPDRIMLPPKAAAMLMRMAESDAVALAFTPQLLGASADRFEMSCSLGLDSVPDMSSQLATTPATHTVTVGKAALLDSLKGMAVATDKVRSVLLRGEGSTLHLSSSDGAEDASDELEAVVSGACQIRMSLTQLVSAVGTIDGDRVRIAMGADHRTPIRVLPAEGEYHQNILMAVLDQGAAP